jgi:hypothetical protein
MVRTIISLDEDDKAWLDRRAKEEGTTMTELVRRAVLLLRNQVRQTDPPLEALIEETKGIWTEGDGLNYQERLRGEW